MDNIFNHLPIDLFLDEEGSFPILATDFVSGNPIPFAYVTYDLVNSHPFPRGKTVLILLPYSRSILSLYGLYTPC